MTALHSQPSRVWRGLVLIHTRISSFSIRATLLPKSSLRRTAAYEPEAPPPTMTTSFDSTEGVPGGNQRGRGHQPEDANGRGQHGYPNASFDARTKR